MNSLCATGSGMSGLTSGVAISGIPAPTGFTVNNSISIPLDSDPDLVLHYPLNGDILNYTGSTPTTGTNDANIVGVNVSLSSSQSIFSGGKSLFKNVLNNTSYFSINNTFTTTNNGISTSFWVYLTNNSSGIIYSFANATNDNSRNFIDFSGGSFHVGGGGNTFSNSYKFTNAYLNRWYHIVWTLDTLNNSKIYVNLNDVFTTSIIKYTNNYSFSLNYIFADTVTNGTSINRGISGGYINDFRLYNRVLNSYEINQLYNIYYLNPPKTVNKAFYLNTDISLVLYYPFDNNLLNYASGVGVSNGSISGDNVFITSSDKVVGSSSLRRQSADSASYFKFNNIRANKGGYTISFWVKPGSGNGTIFIFYGTDTRTRIIMYKSSTILIASPNAQNLSLMNTTYAPVLNTWAFYVWTIATNGTHTFYVDNVQKFTTTGQTSNTYYSIDFSYGYIFELGEVNIGYVDDFRYYNRILTTQERTDLYNYRFSYVNTLNLNSDPFLCLYYTFDTSTNSVSNYAQNVYGTIDASYANGASSNNIDFSQNIVGVASLKLNNSTLSLTTNTTWATSTQGLFNPQQVVIDSSNTYLYVANQSSGGEGVVKKILISNPDTNVSIGNLNNIIGVAIDSNNRYVYISAYGSAVIIQYDNSTTNIVTMYSFSGGSPTAIVIDGTNTYLYFIYYNGSVYSMGQLNINTQVVNLDFATSAQGISSPSQLFFDKLNNYIYFLNNNLNNIVKLVLSTASPPTISSFTDNWATSSQGLDGPNGIAIDSTNTYMYVTNQTSNTVVQILISNPTVFRTYATSSQGLTTPTGIALDPLNNYMYVANYNGGGDSQGTISRIIPSNQYVSLNSNNIVNTTNFIPNYGMSFSFWIDSSNNTLFPGTIFYFGNSSTDYIRCFINSSSISFVVVNISSTLLTINTNYNNIWRYLTWTMSYSSSNTSTWNIYINASIISTTTNNYYPNINTSKPYSYIGNINNSFYNGWIDDFRVYQRVLSQTEITQIYYYNNTLNVKSANLSWTAANTTKTPLTYNYKYETTYSSGLSWKAFYGNSGDNLSYLYFAAGVGQSNNYNTFQYHLRYAGGANTLSSNSANVLTNLSGYNNNIASTNNIFGFLNTGSDGNSGNYISLIISGYFKPNVTGNWTFQFGITGSLSNNDISVFWIDDGNTVNGQTTHWPPTDTNYNVFKNSSHIISNATYTTPILTAGVYYPIQLNWGQSTGGSVLGFYFKPPSGGSYISNGDGYFFYNNPVNLTPVNTSSTNSVINNLLDGNGITYSVNSQVGTKQSTYVSITK